MSPRQPDQGLNVVCVDDNDDILQALQLRLGRNRGFRCVKAFSSAHDLVCHLENAKADELPDVIVMDWAMPDIGGELAIPLVAQRWPAVRVLVLTAHPIEVIVDAAVAAGAWGVVEKCDGLDVLIRAIDRVRRGEFVFQESCASESGGRFV